MFLWGVFTQGGGRPYPGLVSVTPLGFQFGSLRSRVDERSASLAHMQTGRERGVRCLQ
jgi:hypothetical protein